jgi:biopolymer transport protein ExbB/biopolymer transport protein TolQ
MMQQFTLSELWGHTGLFARLVVYVLGLMSLASIVVMAERFVSFVRSGRDSRRFAATLAGALEKSGLDDAAKAQVASPGTAGHLGRVLSAGLRAYAMTRTGGSPDLTIESVARALERQAQREQQNLKRGLNLLATVGSTAPFVGLLGTVVGIINAFQQIAATGSGGLGTVSAGISEALVTTAFGLLVAIPAVMAYNAMQGWVDGRMVDMTESSNELLDHVARNLDEAGRAPARAV